MTVTEMARFSMRKQQYEKNRTAETVDLPNGSTPPPGYVNPHCPPGMDITGRTDWRRIIPVSEELAQKLKDIVLDHMVNNYGMSGTRYEAPELIKAYCLAAPVEDRAPASWTLNQIQRAEAYRLGDIVRAHQPGWQPGQWFDTSILDAEVQKRKGFDVRV